MVLALPPLCAGGRNAGCACPHDLPASLPAALPATSPLCTPVPSPWTWGWGDSGRAGCAAQAPRLPRT